METNVLEKLKSTQISILLDIMNICDIENINYFIIAGTLIGAIRHKGFIPWDDDIDIAMTREDYEVFRQHIISRFTDKYFIQDYETEDLYYQSFAKLRLNGTLYEEADVKNLDIHKGIFVDIFILDSEDKVDSPLFHIRAKIISKIKAILYYKIILGPSKPKTLKEKILVGFSNIFNSDNLKRVQVKLMSMNNKGSSYLLNYGCHYGYKKQIFKKEDYFPPSTALFEGLSVSIPANYDKMLTQIYGDYMQIPNVEDRITHSPIDIKFND